ncbi:MAG: chromate transporter [Eubacteriales bacterium]|nr:chromate transporter [Eubacteriales bacterium]
MTLLLLFYEFFKTGLFAIGGGLATLPFLSQMAQVHPEWFTAEMLADMIAISESTPGPIGVNMATYAGYNAAGIPGALIATLALIAPSIIIIVLIAKFLTRFSDNKLVQGAFYGLRPAVTGLIAAAGVQVLLLSVVSVTGASWQTLSMDINVLAVGIFTAVLILSLKLKKVHPAFYILGAAILGIVFKM